MIKSWAWKKINTIVRIQVEETASLFNDSWSFELETLLIEP